MAGAAKPSIRRFKSGRQLNMQKVFLINSRGIKIAGLLDLPEKKSRYPLVLCLHGFGKGTKEENEKITKILNPQGIATFRIDFHGTGESGSTREEKTLSGFLDDAKTALEFVWSLPRLNKRKVGIYGHSMGATTAILLASQDQRISTVVAATPSIKSDQVLANLYDPKDLAQAKKRGYVELRKNGERKKLHYRFFEDAAKYDITQEAQKISYKFLVIGTTTDTIVPYKQIKNFCEHVSNAQLMTLFHSAHNLKEEWQKVAREIGIWFKNWAE